MPCQGKIGEIVEVRRSRSEVFLEWRIPRFLSLTCGSSADFYKSPFFCFSHACWYMMVWPNWQGLVSLELWREVPSTSTQTVTVAVGVRGSSGVEKRIEEEREFKNDVIFGQGCAWSSFRLTSELSEQKRRLLLEGALTITCEMRVPVTVNDSSTQTDNNLEVEVLADVKQSSVKQEVDILQRSEQDVLISGENTEATLKEQGMEELKESMKRLLVDGKDSDVLVRVQAKEFPAHRLLLQARSPVFEAMFSHDMVEKLRGVVTMEDCDPETFPDFLEHIYTGSIEMISTGNVFSLYAASDKYDLKTLKKACAEFMKKNLTVATFCNAITLAIKYNEKELIEIATEFFCSNLLEICKTVEWQIFLKENTTVGNELIMKAFAK